MKPANRERKNEIGYNIQLNSEQKIGKQIIRDNQITLITGRAGSGKSLLCAQAALDFLLKKEASEIFVTRATIEVGKSLGFLPGLLEDKFNPYMEALIENLYKCKDRKTIDEFVEKKQIKALPIQFIRGKTIEEVLIVEETQNITKHEMLAILTRLGKTGKLIINGDFDQKDIHSNDTGLDYMVELSKNIPEINWVKLKENHRSDLVGKILDYEHRTK